MKHKPLIISVGEAEMVTTEEIGEKCKLSDFNGFAGGQMRAGLTLGESVCVCAPQRCKQEVTTGGDWKAVVIRRDDGMSSVWSTWVRSPAAAPRPRWGNHQTSKQAHVLKAYQCLKEISNILVHEAGFERCDVFGDVFTDHTGGFWSFFQI